VSTDRQSLELELVERERGARALVARGCLAILLIPALVGISVLLGTAFDSFMPLVIAALYTVFGGALGTIWLAAGVIRGRGVKRELRELLDSRIPRARLLE